MTETVTVTPSAGGYDADGNPIAAGDPITLPTLGIAPGNTSLQFEDASGLDDVQFTVYLKLGSPITDDDQITVRGKQCRARVQEWISPWTGRGGVVVLCRSTTGASGG